MDEEFNPALLTGCVLLASRCWALPCNTCRAIRPPHADQPATGGELAAHRLHQRTTLACPRPLLVGHAVELATAQPPPDDDGQVHTDASAGPAPACASFEHEAPTQADDEPGMDPAGDHADPGHPSHPAACPTAALQDLTSAGHSARGNAQTPDADTGRRHRTPDTWTLRRPHRTPVPWTGKRGHWSPDTGHRTLAEDVDRLTKARPASGPRPPRRATARWDAQPCSCGRRLRRSAAHAGSAVRPPSSAK
jgi:hypothetical protein